MTHGDNEDETTDVTYNKLTRLDFSVTKQHKAVEYVVDAIVDHGVVHGETLYRVRCYMYKVKEDSAKPAEDLSDRFIKTYHRF